MRLDFYSAFNLSQCLESVEWEGTFEAYLDREAPQWRLEAAPRFTAYLEGTVWPPARWADALSADAVVRVNLTPQGGIFKAIGNIIGKLFSFLGGSSRGSSSYETPQSRDLNAASGKANTAKLGSVVSELAGRFRKYPDYLTPPRRVFRDKREQWLYFLSNVGPGYYEILPNDIRIGETPVTSFGPDAVAQIIQPGDSLAGVEAAQIWYSSPAVGSTSSGSSGLELTTEPANRVNTDPAQYLFSGSTIGRSDGAYPSGWGLDTIIHVEYPVVYTLTDRVVPPTETEPGYTISQFTGYFGHVRSLNTGTIVSVGPLSSIEKWAVRSITPVGSGIYTLEFETSPGAAPIHDPPGSRTYIFDADLGRSITVFDEGDITVSPGVFETVAKTTVLVFAGGAVYGEWTSEFVATPDGSVTSLLELDSFFPRGLCFLTDEGKLESRSVAVEYQVRDVAGGPRVNYRYTYEDATVDQIGFSEQVPISPMVPMVRARRVGAQSTSTQIQDVCQWYGLKARLPDHLTYPGWTTLALALRSGGKIASQSENQANVIATRILPTLQSDGTWGSPIPTRDITAFARYILQSSNQPDTNLDIAEFLRLNAVWKARGDNLDFVFDATTVKDALEVAFAAGLGEFTCGDGVIRPVREDVRLEAEQSYSPHNMRKPLRRSISSHQTITDYDGVDVEYYNADTWVRETIQCRWPGDQGTRVEKVTLDGVTDRVRAWRVGMRRRGEQIYRRKEYSFSTELDALNSDYKSYVMLFDSYSQTALLKSVRPFGAGGAVFVCSEEFKWTPGASHVVAYRRKDGSFAGPYPAQPGPTSRDIAIAALPTPWPVVSLSFELPHVYFGTTEDFGFPSLLTAVSPRGQFEVSVSAVNYDARVYQYDNAFPPA